MKTSPTTPPTLSTELTHPPKVCLTAAACLIHEGRVLLIKHKKLGLWLCPGGHLEPGEMPHQAAERECFEETGIRVRAKRVGFCPPSTSPGEVMFLPIPVSSNVHWISHEMYDHRVLGEVISFKIAQQWPRGCEQHFGMIFLVEPLDSVDITQNLEETDAVGWFTADELQQLDLKPTMRQELAEAFRVSALG